MLITVITVAWNAGSTIGATCASVDAQLHGEIEHLVIDGASTDDTQAVLARHPHARRQVFSEPDDGLYDAMNKGLARARGEIVVFLNADDRYCTPHALTEVHRVFVEQQADAVYADIDMVEQAEPVRVQRRWRSGRYARWKVLVGWQIPHPALFIRRTVLERIGGFDTRFRIAADYDMMLHLTRERGVKLAYCPLTVVEMSVGGISTAGMQASWRGYLESAEALGKHVGVAGYLIAILKPIWKLPQWIHSRSDKEPRAARLRVSQDGTQRPVIDGLARAPEPASGLSDVRLRTTVSRQAAASAAVEDIRPLHIGKFVPPPYAGIESHVNTLLTALAPTVQATLVASAPIGGRTSPPSPVPYRIIACRSYGTVASVAITPGLLATVGREFAAGRANLLHLHAPNPWGDLAALRSDRDTPVVMTWHSDIVGKPALFSLYQGMQARTLRRVDRIILFTPKHFQGSTQLKVKGIENKFVQVPIGVDFASLDATPPDAATTDWIDRWSAGRRVILSAGRLVHYKGYEHLIDAMARLRSDAVLLLIGTGPLRNALRRRVEERGLRDRIHFMGEVPPAVLTAALRRCDLFTLPSIEQSEAFGIASAEAMAFGMPTVVCELNNGVNYLNLAGRTSLVTPPRDTSALADALDTLVRDDALRARMGAAARQWVRSEFDVDVMRAATLALYRELM